MTQKDKKLLFKDICARLPYGVRLKVWLKEGITEEGFLDLEHNYADVLRDAFYYNKIKDIKPYLRPMSSMTDEEVREFYVVENMAPQVGYIYPTQDWHFTIYGIDWLNKNHFDYRGLIPRGLAIEVTKDNNPYK